MTSDSVEHLVADDIQGMLWLRLRRLTSAKLARQVIQQKTRLSDEDVLQTKAKGVAFAVRSALGYWQSKAESLNARILSRYYALLHLSIAEQVASADPLSNLASVQKHTEFGHGLVTLQGPNEFPHGYFVGCLSSGHFGAYCRHRFVDPTPFTLAKRPRVWDDVLAADREKLISLSDLFRRMPELQPMIRECLGGHPLSFRIGFGNKNLDERRSGDPTGLLLSGRSVKSAPEPATKRTCVAIFPQDGDLTKEYLSSLTLPVRNIEVEEDSISKSTHFIGEFEHPNTGIWWQHIDTYKSSYCGTSLIVPLWDKTTDPVALHLMILYASSIVVRYLPSLWHDICDGKLDHIRALLEHYIAIADAVLPRIALERITGTQVMIAQAGSLNAPI